MLLLTSLTTRFVPVPGHPRIFECNKNGQIQFPLPNGKDIKGRPIMKTTVMHLSELYFVVYPIQPKTYDEINHGHHTDILVFPRIELDDRANNITEFLELLKKDARTNPDIFVKTFNMPIEVLDLDPAIEFELPPESPLNVFRNLSEDVLVKTKLPAEIDHEIESRIICLSSDGASHSFYFGHVVGLYIFVDVDALTEDFTVRHYTSPDNERYEYLRTFVEIKSGQVKSYVEFGDNEEMLITRNTIIGQPNFVQFISDVYKFDHKKYIELVQKSPIGNTVQNDSEKRKKIIQKMTSGDFDDEEDDAEFISFLGFGGDKGDFYKSLTQNMLDMYGNPQMF